MKLYRIYLIIFLLLFTLVLTEAGKAEEVPKLSRRVTDLAGVMTGEQADEIERRLSLFEDTTSTQLVVLIISSLEGEDIAEYAYRVASENGIGQKGKDNGALFLASIGDRKMRFEVGYGLEPTLTDAYTRVIQDRIIVPHFKNENYFQGILEGMDAAMRATQGEFTAEESSAENDDGVLPFFIVVFVFFIILAIARSRGKGGGRGTSRTWTAGGGSSSIWTSGSSWGGGGGGGFSGGWSGGGGSFGGGGSSSSW